jgi:hypothetical protein
MIQSLATKISKTNFINNTHPRPHPHLPSSSCKEPFTRCNIHIHICIETQTHTHRHTHTNMHLTRNAHIFAARCASSHRPRHKARLALLKHISSGQWCIVDRTTSSSRRGSLCSALEGHLHIANTRASSWCNVSSTTA